MHFGRVVSASGSKTSVSSSTPASIIIYDAYTSIIKNKKKRKKNKKSSIGGFWDFYSTYWISSGIIGTYFKFICLFLFFDSAFIFYFFVRYLLFLHLCILKQQSCWLQLFGMFQFLGYWRFHYFRMCVNI